MREMLRDGKECSLKFWKKDGSIVTIGRCVMTSSFFGGNTFNVKCLDSGEIRKIRAVTIFEINDFEVFL
jgi:hypothetical protein